MLVAAFLCNEIHVQGLNLSACPGGAAQKFEAGFHTRLTFKAVDIHRLGHFLPAHAGDQLIEQGLEGDAVQGIIDLFIHGKLPLKPGVHSTPAARRG